MGENLKIFTIRIPKNLWVYLKSKAAMQERSMGSLLNQMIQNDKKNSEKRLTKNATNVNL
jgi:hypothetical protein